MQDYKINALNRFLHEKGLSYKFASSLTTPYKLIVINNIPIYARLADTFESVEKGLMGVTKLSNNEGCLLCFSSESPANLWMKNCKINLQTATIDKTGKIIDILNMYYTEPYYIHRSTQPVKYALEMPEGFFTQHSIKTGDMVRLK